MPPALARAPCHAESGGPADEVFGSVVGRSIFVSGVLCSPVLSEAIRRCKMELPPPHGDIWSQERRSYFLNKKQGGNKSKSINMHGKDIYLPRRGVGVEF